MERQKVPQVKKNGLISSLEDHRLSHGSGLSTLSRYCVYFSPTKLSNACHSQYSLSLQFYYGFHSVVVSF